MKKKILLHVLVGALLLLLLLRLWLRWLLLLLLLLLLRWGLLLWLFTSNGSSSHSNFFGNISGATTICPPQDTEPMRLFPRFLAVGIVLLTPRLIF